MHHDDTLHPAATPRRRLLVALATACALAFSLLHAGAAEAAVSPERSGSVVGCGSGANGIRLYSTSGMQWSIYGWIPLRLDAVAIAPRIALHTVPAPLRWRPTGFNTVYVWGSWFFANTGDECATTAAATLPPGGPGFRFGR
ncbi:MAG: hypothetical protein JWM98_1427 [Thermoleophilia bacterium]|nr:hypothetical protein [Thermoleophilia bacterium]